MSFSEIFEQIKTGLAGLAAHRRDAHETNLKFLARFEKRAAWTGSDWTWRDMIETPEEVARLRAQNLPTNELRRRCDALLAMDAKSKPRLVQEIENGASKGMRDRVAMLLEKGEDPNAASLLKDVPLAYARYFGHRDVFDLLIEKGADPEKIGFSGLHLAVRYGTAEAVKAQLHSLDVLEAREDADSVLHEAVHTGRSDILALVLGKVAADRRITSDEVTKCLCIAIEINDATAVETFLSFGVDPSGGLDATLIAFNVGILKLLLAHGADVRRISDISYYHEDPLRITDQNGQTALPGYVDLLLDAGWTADNIGEFEEDQLRYITGTALYPKQDVTVAGFADPAGVFAGHSNPTDVTSAYHLEMLRTGDTPHMMRSERIPQLPKPAWTTQRFGQSTSRLPDGSWVQVGGQHEDFYDPDYVVFSDVILIDPKGVARVFVYPGSVFPPTDSHSATVLPDAIWIIGNLGYMAGRKPSETPVYRLSLVNFSIQKITTTGEVPGWISKHDATLSDGKIIVSGGVVWDGQALLDQHKMFALDIKTHDWASI